MKTIPFLVLCSLVVTMNAFADEPNTLTAKEKADGWQLLFNGKTLDGWKAKGGAEGWAIEEGVIACMLKGGDYLYSAEQFGDYILSLDFKVDKGVNSGVFFRWSNLNDPVNTGIEMQVLDSAGIAKPGKHDCGALYDIVAPSKNMAKPAGEWNTTVITCKDNMISVALNGEKVCEIDLNQWIEVGKNPDGSKNKFNIAYKDLPRKGHIGFQDHGGRVWYRNVKLKAL